LFAFAVALELLGLDSEESAVKFDSQNRRVEAESKLLALVYLETLQLNYVLQGPERP
jgi:hypothetical protein